MTKLKIYGCKGAGSGETSSYVLETDKELIFLDAGLGLIDASGLIFGNPDKEVHMLLSHTHIDHIEGMPVAGISYSGKDKVKVKGPKGFKDDLKQYMDKNLFPIDYDDLPAYHNEEELDNNQEFMIGDNVKVKTFFGYHPMKGRGGSIGYRIEIKEKENTKIITYATDFEFDYTLRGENQERLEGPESIKNSDELKQAYIKFIDGSDILIADAEYTSEEYLEDKGLVDIRGWGHSYIDQIVDFAKKGNVKKLCITHHNRNRKPEFFEEYTKKLNETIGNLEEIVFTQKGDILTL